MVVFSKKKYWQGTREITCYKLPICQLQQAGHGKPSAHPSDSDNSWFHHQRIHLSSQKIAAIEELQARG